MAARNAYNAVQAAKPGKNPGCCAAVGLPVRQEVASAFRAGVDKNGINICNHIKINFFYSPYNVNARPN